MERTNDRASAANQRWFTRGILGIGLANLFSDWGHEAATALLPALLALVGAPAVALGIIEGVADGLSSFTKLAGGWIADRPKWRKPIAGGGYVIVGLTTFAYAFAQSWPVILILRAVGWAGRGAQSPSRDALLADAVAPSQLGRAFGFERAMDTVGAVAGPLTAVALVSLSGIRAALRWTILPGLAASACFFWLVPTGKSVGSRRAVSFAGSLQQLPQAFRRLLVGVFAHGIGDFAPTLLILRASQVLAAQYGIARASALAIALYTVHNVVFAAIAYPRISGGSTCGQGWQARIGCGRIRCWSSDVRGFYFRANKLAEAGSALCARRSAHGSSASAREVDVGGVA
ncbi:MAG TPA: MFS transporter [Candidatus Acidoferrales bacterium]|nr:MFS transporter [Candidatus Acidoferrales bacterium]